MREIKFRAWHTGLNRMFSAEEMSADQLTLLPTGKFINVHGSDARLSKIYDDMIPEQFTGLRDRNGCEIYEGDIIQTETCVAAVVFDECQFGLRAKPDKNYVGALMDLITWRSIEIIGNIHENPELLS